MSRKKFRARKPARPSAAPGRPGISPRVAGQLATVCQIADCVLDWAESNVAHGERTDPAALVTLRSHVSMLRQATGGASPAELEWLPSCLEGHLARMIKRAAAVMDSTVVK